MQKCFAFVELHQKEVILVQKRGENASLRRIVPFLMQN